MFKNKAKFQNFVKRQVAKVLAVVMAFSSFASTGMVLNSAHAAPTYTDDGGKAFVEKLVEITAAGTPYVWGGWQYNPETGYSQVDCRGFVRVALRDVYNLNIFETVGYLVDENDDPILKNGQKQWIDVAAYDSVSTLRKYVGQRICVENSKTGLRTYYRVAVADTCGNLKNGGGNRWSEWANKGNALDIKFNGSTYSSLIAYACKFPGSIISHNGHYGVAIGEFHNKADIISEYPGLDGPNSGNRPQDGIIRWSQSAYDLGNSYAQDDPRYWFGKTVFLSACSSASGIRADNFTTTGKSSNPGNGDGLSILLCERVEPATSISFTKIDQATGDVVVGAQYGLYKDAACTKLVTTFTTSTPKVVVGKDKEGNNTLPLGVYYVKELVAPSGYTLSTQVIKVDATKEEPVSVELKDAATDATVFVRKVDSKDSSILLSDAVFKIMEYNSSSKKYNDLVTLTYVSSTQAYTINSSYTNGEGVTYSDNALHYTQLNQGKFALVEVSAPNGYQPITVDPTYNGKLVKEFNILDGGLVLMGDKAVKNDALLALQVIKTDAVTGARLAGAVFELTYNGNVYTATTNANGIARFMKIPEGQSLTGTLRELSAPDGYSATTSLKNGIQISFSKGGTPTSNGYMTSVTVVNIPDGEEKVEPKSGSIVIRKTDGSRIDNIDIPVPDTHYAIYTDAALTTVATDLDGKVLNDLITDANGTVIADNLAFGIYYIRETHAPEDYAIQPKTFVVNLTSDGANAAEVTFTVPGVMDLRQVVTLDLQKVDKNTKQPVAGAVYALYTGSTEVTSINGLTLNKDTLIGYYVTGEDGHLISYPNRDGYYAIGSQGQYVIDKYGSPEITVNGVTYEAVEVLSADGKSINGEPLVNGHYYFVEVAAPNGYVLDTTRHNVKATWISNDSVNDVSTDWGVASPGGFVMAANTVVVEDARQSIKIVFNKLDAELNTSNTDDWYDVNDYESAVNNGMAATLEGALYRLTNTVDIVDITTGYVIPANTTIGLYRTNANGSITITKMTQGAYDGHAIPNGSYRLVEVTPPQGYALSNKTIDFSVNWSVANAQTAQVTVSKTDSDEILKQALTIHKIDGETSGALSGVMFNVYSVAEIMEKCNISADELPWDLNSVQQNGYHTIDRDAFQDLIEEYDLSPIADLSGNVNFTTAADGTVTTGDFVYGDYIIYEVAAPEDYIPSNAIYIQLPWVKAEVSDGSSDKDEDGDNGEQTIVVEYIHNVYEQPEGAYTQQVVNLPEDVIFNLSIIKTDADNNSPILSNHARFELYDADGVLVGTIETDDNGVASITGLVVGNYTLKEIAAPTGFIASTPISISVTKTNVAVTSNDPNVTHTVAIGTDGNRTITIRVPNAHEKVNVVIINKYEMVNGQRVAVAGATLQILDRNGNIVELADGSKCEWITTNTSTTVDEYGLPAHEIIGLPDGDYILREAQAPAGYITASDIHFTVGGVATSDLVGGQQPQYVYVYMQNRATEVEFLKVDDESYAHIVGAKLGIVDSNGNLIEQWTTNGSAHKITHLLIGTYRLVELDTPVGYQKAQDIEFVVSDEPSGASITMRDDRTYGTLELTKTDSKTGRPLNGVVFNLVSVNEVVDPSTNEIIFTAGQIVEVLTTDENGYAKTNNQIPIGTYGLNGEFELIQYQLVETKAVSGEQYETIAAIDIEFNYINDSTPIVNVSLNLQNSKPEIIVHKTGTPETFVGNYANRNNVTVVENGDLIEYTITIQNIGMASAWNVVVRDPVPDNTTFVSVDNVHNATYDAATNSIYWDINEIRAGNTVELKFTVKANRDTACEIVNIAEYAMPDEIPTSNDDRLDPKNDDNNWNATEAVVHQIVEFHKTSTVPGGTTQSNATVVNPGDNIKYTLTFTSVDIVSGVVITDIIPAGLTYVIDSAKSNVNLQSATYDNATRTLTFVVDGAIPAGTATFEFDVSVDDIENGEHRYYENVAYAKYNNREDGEEKELISEVVTHQSAKQYTVVKTGTPETYTGVLANATNLTVLQKGDNIVYTITATNTGNSTITNLVIVDTVPTGTKFVSHNTPEGVLIWQDADTNKLTWCIEELAISESISVTFTVAVVKQQSQIIVNAAYYDDVNDVGNSAPVLDNPNKTDDVVHQVIEFHKSSEIIGGTTENDATPVAVGDKIIYTLKLINDSKLTNVVVTDVIPQGLTIDLDSVQIKHGVDGEWTHVEADYDSTSRTISFANTELLSGEHYFQFSVSVNYIPVNTAKWFLNKATVAYDANPGTINSPKDSLESEIVTHMTDNKIVGVKTSDPETYVGPYASKQNVTVIQDGDQITYTITISNVGASVVRNVVIRDVVPNNTVFVNALNNGTYYANGNYVEWIVNELLPGQSTNVQFVVECDGNNQAVEIVNIAQYAAPHNPQDVQDDEWLYTDAVVHQTIELHKTSVVTGGSTVENATAVSPGDTVHYIITFTAVDDVYDVVVTDKIPNGMTFVDGSATIEGIADSATVDEDGVITFSSTDIVGKTVKFEFDVTVDDIDDSTKVYYLNTAYAEYFERGESGDRKIVESETVTHCADKSYSVVKHGYPSTFEGDYEYHQDVTVLQKSDIVTYELVASNNGNSEIHNLVIVDSIPDGMTYVAHDSIDGVTIWLDDAQKTITWCISAVAAGESVVLNFTAQVQEQKAQVIINNADYGTVDTVGPDAPTLNEDSKFTTNDVVYQVIEFHKSSEIVGGVDENSATLVSVGDEITYTLSVLSKEDLTGVEIVDGIHDGLTFVPGSIEVRHGSDGAWEHIDDANGFVDNTIKVLFDNIKAGETSIRFKVTVDRIPVNTSAFFVNQATVFYDVIPDDDTNKDSLISETVTHMTEILIDGSKDGKIETYVGKYESKNNVTVVDHGDVITYTITLTNTGRSNIYNAIIRDMIPEHTTFKSVENNGIYHADENYVEWIVDELAIGESITVQFDVICNSNGKAVEIVNIAQYAVPEDINDVRDEEWIFTDCVIYQTVEMHKSSVVAGGIDKATAKPVSPGDIIHYVITFKAVDDVYNITISDMIPSGLTYVDGSATIDGIVDSGAHLENGTNNLVFSTINANNQVVEFAFDVTVDEIPDHSTAYYENVANATYSTRNDKPVSEEIESEVVTHFAEKTYHVIKHGTPTTFEGQYTYHKDVTVLKAGDNVTYTLIASNDGQSDVHNLVIVDHIPDGMEYVGHDTIDGVDIWVDSDNRMITWNIRNLEAGKKLSVNFTTSVKEQKAQVIINNARYDTVDDIADAAPVLDDNARKTNDVVYQVVEFHKMSEIVGGFDKHSATPVAAGDTILYTLQLIANEDLTGVVFTDVIPDGLTFVPGSIEIKHSTEDVWSSISDQIGYSVNEDERGVVAVNVNNVAAGEFYVRFKVTVDHIPVNTEAFFINQAIVQYDVMPNDETDTATGTLVSEQISHMTETKIVGVKDGLIKTYVGAYDEKKNVTVVENGDDITYAISITNTGASGLYNVIIRDNIPENTVFKSVAHAGTYNAEQNYVEWIIPELPVGATVTVNFVVTCDSDDKAVEIVNIARYAVPIDVENVRDDEWVYTDYVIYQTVELHKESIVVGGNSKDDAVAVSPGDTIHYIITFTAIDDVYNVVVKDRIPDGLTYVDGSATINGTTYGGAKLNQETNELVFSQIDMKNETVKFEFDVLVDDIGDGETKYYLNIAQADYSTRGDDGESNTLETEIVSHYADKQFSVVKHGTPDTFEGNYTYHENVTVLKADDVITYELIATNDGNSSIRNLVIVDKIPDGLTYLSHSSVDGVDIWVDATSETITWCIKEIPVGEHVAVQFKACVEEQKAQIIINNALYGTVNVVDDKAPTLGETSRKTNDVVHQVVEFHKTSEVIGGTNSNDATPVAVGDTIIYTLKFSAKEDLTNVLINDEIPTGLTFVPGSIAIKHSTWDEWVNVTDADGYVENENYKRTVAYNQENMKAGDFFLRFSVTVDYIPANSSAFFINQATATYDVMPDYMSENAITATLMSEQVSHMTETKIEGFKNGVIATYVGDYESRHNITVVNDGDDIVYVLTIANTGVSDLRNVVVRDSIPMHTVFKSAENDGVYNSENNYVEWVVDELKAGESASVTFTVTCNSEGKAVEIRNIASYAAPENPDDIRADEWMWTDEVIYQTVEFHKSASIDHGVDLTDAKYVKIGSKFTYILTFNTTNTVYGLNVMDKLPLGLSYVKDSAIYQIGDGEAQLATVVIDESRNLTFNTIDEVPAGTVTFKFDVVVEDVKEYDIDYFFVNQAFASIATSYESDDTINLVSETVSHKTIKTNEIDEPKLGDDGINESLIWTSVAVMSTIAMFIFGYYGFIDDKKRR